MTLVFDVAIGITSAISLIGFIYLLAYWKGRVDSFMSLACVREDKYPIAEIAVQVKTLWEVYGVRALVSKPDLAASRSLFGLTEKGRALIPESIKTQLDKIPGLDEKPAATASAWLAVEALGVEDITSFAHERGLSLSEGLGLLGLYLDELRRKNRGP